MWMVLVWGLGDGIAGDGWFYEEGGWRRCDRSGIDIEFN